MGGLVSRSYVQSNDYDMDVNKLLMLGTPNHGAYISYRIYYAHFLDELIPWLNKDDQAPAYRQMVTCSPFLYNLFESDPKPLSLNSDIKNDYLIVHLLYVLFYC